MAYSVASITGTTSNSKVPFSVTLLVSDFASEAALTAIMDNYEAELGVYTRYEDGVKVAEAGTSTIIPTLATPQEYSTYAQGFAILKLKGQQPFLYTIPVTAYTTSAFFTALWDTGKYEYLYYFYREFNDTYATGSFGANYSNHNTPINVTK